MNRKAVLLVNLGSPLSPKVSDVRRYLRQFLMDGRVINKSYLFRWMLVNLIIAPFRSYKSAKAYTSIWNGKSFPLIRTGHEVVAKVQALLGDEYEVFLAMRYQQPSIESILKEIQSKGFSSIKVIPLFPQYASATSGSVVQEVMRVVSRWTVIPKITFVDKFYDHPLFSKAFAAVAESKVMIASYDAFIFSYHGIPKSQLAEHTRDHVCLNTLCEYCERITAANQYCYRSQCVRTTQRIARALRLPATRTITSFQSRLGSEEWTGPYTHDVIESFGRQGKKKILVFSPAFVADCLETTIEIGEEYKEMFHNQYGGQLDLVPSLNTNPVWIQLLHDLAVDKYIPASPPESKPVPLTSLHISLN
jgi:ferrochelatase